MTCADHIADEERLPYLAWHAEADRAYKKRRERQVCCDGCSKWIFPFEMRPTSAQSEKKT